MGLAKYVLAAAAPPAPVDSLTLYHAGGQLADRAPGLFAFLAWETVARRVGSYGVRRPPTAREGFGRAALHTVP